jgi:small subunit ribosomal protein S4
MRFSGPKVKKSRALGVALTPKAQRVMRKKGHPPGQHGRNRRRRRSEYGAQLLEKQRLRFQYNVGERYLKRLFGTAATQSGPTGENLVQLLESRLDALVLRAGFAPTIYAARQYVNHGHFEINGRKASIPSQRLRPGDVLAVRPRSRPMLVFTDLRPGVLPAPYLALGEDGFSARYVYLPTRAEVPVICQEQMVVEYYSR